MATVNDTSFQAYLKTFFVDNKMLWKLDEYGMELLGLMPKDPTAAADTWKQPVTAAGIVGGSGDQLAARLNASTGLDVAFGGTNATWKNAYHDAYIDDKTIKVTRNDEGAFKKVLEFKMDGLRQQFLQATDFQLYRDEAGAMGQLLTGTIGGTVVTTFNGASVTITCQTGSFTPQTVGAMQFLKPGMVIVVGDGSGSFVGGGGATSTILGPTQVGTTAPAGGLAGTAGGALRVISVDSVGNSFVTDYQGIALGAQNGGNSLGNPTTAGGSTSGSAVYVQGNQNATIAGLASWAPLDVSIARASFKGVDRSQEVRALGGIRISANQGGSIQETVIQLVSDARQYGANPQGVFMHYKNHAALIKSLGSSVEFVRMPGQTFGTSAKAGAKAKTGRTSSVFGFEALKVAVGGRPVPVYGTAACQSNVIWGVEFDSLKFTSTGMFPQPRDEDGLKLLRQLDTSYIFELLGYGELLCAAPGHQANCVLF